MTQNLPEEIAKQNLPQSEIDTTYPWLRMSDKSRRAIDLAKRTRSKRYGMYAQIPVICKGSDCAYADTCVALMSDCAPVGEPCAVEIAIIETYFQQLVSELNVDPTQIVNLGLLKDVIEQEVIINRCNAILAKDGNIIQQIPIGSTPQGTIINAPQQHIALTVRENARKAKAQALQLLNSTPKDKAKTGGITAIDNSTYASKILKAYMELQERQKAKVIDVEAKSVPPVQTETSN